MIEAIASKGPGPLSYKVQLGSHEIMTDVGADQGGGNLGSTPHDLLSAALASCTSMTVTMYAQHKGWPLQSLETHVRQEKDGEATVFKRTLTFHCKPNLPLSQEQKTRLIDIANRCPVHHILSGTIRIETSVEA